MFFNKIKQFVVTKNPLKDHEEKDLEKAILLIDEKLQPQLSSYKFCYKISLNEELPTKVCDKLKKLYKRNGKWADVSIKSGGGKCDFTFWSDGLHHYNTHESSYWD